MRLERSVGARPRRASLILLLLHRSEQIHPHAEEMFGVKQGATQDPAAGIPKKSLRRSLQRGGQRPSHMQGDLAKGSSSMGGKCSQGIKRDDQTVSVPSAQTRKIGSRCLPGPAGRLGATLTLVEDHAPDVVRIGSSPGREERGYRSLCSPLSRTGEHGKQLDSQGSNKTIVPMMGC